MAMISVPPSLALDLVSIDAHAWKFTSGSLQFPLQHFHEDASGSVCWMD
jgi:hypothetical protein